MPISPKVDISEIIKMHDEGMTCPQIAAVLGCHRSTVYKRLVVAGVLGTAKPTEKQSAAKLTIEVGDQVLLRATDEDMRILDIDEKNRLIEVVPVSEMQIDDSYRHHGWVPFADIQEIIEKKVE